MVKVYFFHVSDYARRASTVKAVFATSLQGAHAIASQHGRLRAYALDKPPAGVTPAEMAQFADVCRAWNASPVIVANIQAVEQRRLDLLRDPWPGRNSLRSSP